MKEKKQEQEYYIPYHYKDLFCEETRLILGISQEIRMKILLENVKECKAKKILDIGCGDARFIYNIKNWCKENKIEIYGQDYNKNVLLFAKAFNPDINFYSTSISKIKKKFDLIILSEVLEHIEPKKINKFLKQIKKRITKNGNIIITVPSKNLPIMEKHYQHFSLESLKKTINPYFSINKAIGFHKLSYKRTIYNKLRKIGVIVYPLRYKLKLFWYYNFLKKFYIKNLELCKPDNGYHILVICKPK